MTSSFPTGPKFVTATKIVMTTVGTVPELGAIGVLFVSLGGLVARRRNVDPARFEGDRTIGFPQPSLDGLYTFWRQLALEIAICSLKWAILTVCIQYRIAKLLERRFLGTK